MHLFPALGSVTVADGLKSAVELSKCHSSRELFASRAVVKHVRAHCWKRNLSVTLGSAVQLTHILTAWLPAWPVTDRSICPLEISPSRGPFVHFSFQLWPSFFLAVLLRCNSHALPSPTGSIQIKCVFVSSHSCVSITTVGVRTFPSPQKESSFLLTITCSASHPSPHSPRQPLFCLLSP